MKSEINLAICGQGAVTPAGVGVEALLRNEAWPRAEIALLSEPEKKVAAFRVDLNTEPFLRWQREPRLRRVSPITLFLVEAAAQALAGLSKEELGRTGVVAAYSTGSIQYSRRFFQGCLEQGRAFASPALFPETVFNSPTSHLASVFGLSGACYSVVGDDSAWVGALRVADVWLRTGQADYALVVGAEELDASALEAYRMAGWLRRGSRFIPSEGAGVVLLKKDDGSGLPVIVRAEDGFIYRNPKQAAQAASACLEKFPSDLPIYPSAKNTWLADIEEKLFQGRCVLEKTFADCGEAFTASAAWHTLRALSLLGKNAPPLIVPCWGLNQQVAALQIGKS
ncbi:MAG: beta-ketoacyl synthase N-terminal-like domain-containing protein [bacterium]